MKSKSDNEQQSSSWWEFYVVRYGIGTVIGAILIFMICKDNDTLRPLLFGADAKLAKLDSSLLTLLVGYGLTYCFIASAPILVFHASRFKIDLGESKKCSGSSSWAKLLIPPFFVTFLYALKVLPGCGLSNIHTLLFLVAAIVIWGQYYAISQALRHTNELFMFYKELAEKRHSARGGFTESYRHLREHGNSFLIVLFEIVLALLLIITSDFHESEYAYVAGIFIWIMPASLVWLVGTAIERQFIDNK